MATLMVLISFPRHTDDSGGVQSALRRWHVMMGNIDVDAAVGCHRVFVGRMMTT